MNRPLSPRRSYRKRIEHIPKTPQQTEIGRTLMEHYNKHRCNSKLRTPRTLTRLMQKHREGERHRHRGINASILEISKQIPGYEESMKETIIVKLHRIINYICHLESHIQDLCHELDIDMEFKNLFLSPNMTNQDLKKAPAKGSGFHYPIDKERILQQALSKKSPCRKQSTASDEDEEGLEDEEEDGEEDDGNVIDPQETESNDCLDLFQRNAMELFDKDGYVNIKPSSEFRTVELSDIQDFRLQKEILKNMSGSLKETKLYTPNSKLLKKNPRALSSSKATVDKKSSNTRRARQKTKLSDVYYFSDNSGESENEELAVLGKKKKKVSGRRKNRKPANSTKQSRAASVNYQLFGGEDVSCSSVDSYHNMFSSPHSLPDSLSSPVSFGEARKLETPTSTATQFEDGPAAFHSYARPKFTGFVTIGNRKTKCISPDDAFSYNPKTADNLSCQSYPELTDIIEEPKDNELTTATDADGIVNLEESDEEQLNNKDPFLSDTVDIKKPVFRISNVTGSAFHGFTEPSVPVSSSAVTVSSKNSIQQTNSLYVPPNASLNRVFVIKNNRSTAEALGRCIEKELGKSFPVGFNKGPINWYCPPKAESVMPSKLQENVAQAIKSENKANFTPAKAEYASIGNKEALKNQRFPLSPMENCGFGMSSENFPLNASSSLLTSPETPGSNFSQLLKLDEDPFLQNLNLDGDRIDMLPPVENGNLGWSPPDSLGVSQSYSQESGFQSFCGSENSENFTPVSRTAGNFTRSDK